ncbi:hypothetical protein A0H81_11836 [Grifola frondosa]|uniref:FK506-binding protein n=1 Tax=Grifola frondosa TaxID=5627 RepID=A0A1C7LV13_GRIFR|nr:hypothetical protein A0H81_11836 [Grifola frondosa]
MAVAVALWSIEIKPGQPEPFTPATDLRITNIALGDELADESGRTTVKLVYHTPGSGEDSDEEDEEHDHDHEHPMLSLSRVLFCAHSLRQDRTKYLRCYSGGEEEVLFEVVGKNTVYLTGNYIDQTPPDQVPYNGDSEPDSDEEDFDLRDVSSDVEMNPEELDISSDEEGRFEEIHEEAPKTDSKKRPRQSIETEEPAEKLSKSQQKKLNKKLKAEDGKAVATGVQEKPEEKSVTKAEAKKEKKSKKDDGKKVEEGKKAEEKVDGEKKAKGETKELAGGVKIMEHTIGTGPQAKKGDTVWMRYIGKLQNGKVFDKKFRFKFRLGQGEVIKGLIGATCWDVGVAGMKAGGERLLTIPPNMGYGKSKQAGIPANSTLIFEVKLTKIE